MAKNEVNFIILQEYIKQSLNIYNLQSFVSKLKIYQWLMSKP